MRSLNKDLLKNIEYKNKISTEMSVWNIKLPSNDVEWKILSHSDILDKKFIDKYSNFLMLEYIILNEKNKFRKKVSDDYGAEINWNKIVYATMYRPRNTEKPKSTPERKLTLQLIKDHWEYVDWDEICKRHYISNINEDFLYEFYSFIDWNILIGNTYEEIDNKIIDELTSLNILNWNIISSLEHYPKNFLTSNADKINWDIFIKTHNFFDIPIECRSREDLLLAIKNNPDLLHLRCDRESITETSSRLKRYVWVDRVPGDEGHFQDDTGLWIDDMNCTSNDVDNLASLEEDIDNSPKNNTEEQILNDDELSLN
jgi:hypothetical protein